MVSIIEVMKFIYFNSKEVKELSLSKRQVELIGYLKFSKATSRDIADKYDICVQNSSQQLNNLFRKGYLTRVEIEDKTGGYLFEYTANVNLFT
jgi:predicted DNA-binding transcriptional regulator